MVMKQKIKIKNCAECGKIFSPVRNENLCRDCSLKAEEKEREVLDYVRDHQNCSMKEAMQAIGVSEKFIRNMINKGLFSNIERVNITYPCASCGKPIKSGTYCSECQTKLVKETKKMAKEMATRAGIKSTKVTPIDPNLSTIEKLNVQAEREFEREQQTYKKPRRGTYEFLVREREGRSLDRKNK